MSDSAALSTQIGGTHYKGRNIQPVEVWALNKWDAFAGSILKYLTRWRDKGGVADLEKALHFAQMRMELKGAQDHIRNAIWMNKYCKANNLGEMESICLLALEQWVDMGIRGNFDCYEYLTFVKLLSEFIEQEKKNDQAR